MEIGKEKKVEYIELIYDLVFVWMIGKNASLLDRIEAGFVSVQTFADYVIASLIVLQIWNRTTLFINRFGKNGLSDKVMMLINMFLLYFMGANTIHGWDMNYPVYMGAWCLILVNLAVQYLMKLSPAGKKEEEKHIRRNALSLLIQAACIALSIPVRARLGWTLGPWAVLVGTALVPFIPELPANFAHLTERVMLYVVFTFGDMLLIIGDYFTGGFTFETVWFGLVSLLIVAGMFFSYGCVYDRLLDRRGERGGRRYMALHVFLILSLSCVTASLEFMRDPDVAGMPRTVMTVLSVAGFFLGLILTERWSFRRFSRRRRFLISSFAGFLAFAAAMILTEGISGYLTSGILLLFVYAQLGLLLSYGRYTKGIREEAGI